MILRFFEMFEIFFMFFEVLGGTLKKVQDSLERIFNRFLEF